MRIQVKALISIYGVIGIFSLLGAGCKLTLKDPTLAGAGKTSADVPHPIGTLAPDAASSFAGATLFGAAELDASQTFARLGTAASNRELDSSWSPATDKLIGYWKLNGTAGPIVDGDLVPAALGPNGTASNSNSSGLNYGTGRIGEAVTFDGADDFIQFGNFAGANFGTDDFTVAFWMKSVSATTPALISKRASGGHANFWNVRMGSGHVALEVDEDSTGTNYNSVTTSQPVNDGTWHHVVYTRSGPVLSIYVDGTFDIQSAGPGTANLSNATPFRFGTLDVGDSYYAGQLDEVAIWRSALRASAILGLYQHQSAKRTGTILSRTIDGLTSGHAWTSLSWKTTLPFLKSLPDATCSPVPCVRGPGETSSEYSSLLGVAGGGGDLISGIAALWHLDDPAGTVNAQSVRDDSGNGRYASPNGGVRFGGAGILGNAADFDGAPGSYLKLPSAAASALPISVAIWFRTVQGGVLISNSDVAPESVPAQFNPILYVRNDGFLGGYVYAGGATPVAGIVSSRTVNDGQWHHAVYVSTSSGQSQYLDGQLTGTAVASALSLAYLNLGTGYTNAWAQANSGWFYFRGMMDEVAIWNRELHASEILQLYRRGANRVKFQVRGCTLRDCSDDLTETAWKGPDGTNQSSFTEFDNRTLPGPTSSGLTQNGAPSVTFSNFALPVSPSRYFQFRALLESDDMGMSCAYGASGTAEACSPELKSVTILPASSP